MYELSTHVRTVTDADGATILDLNANQILALNQIGAFILERIKQRQTVPEIVNALVEASSGDQAEIARDTQDFVNELLARGLITSAAARMA